MANTQDGNASLGYRLMALRSETKGGPSRASPLLEILPLDGGLAAIDGLDWVTQFETQSDRLVTCGIRPERTSSGPAGHVRCQPITDMGYESRAAAAGQLMAQPVHPQLRK